MELRSIRVMSWWHFFKHFPSPYTKLLWKIILLTIAICLILKEPLFFSKQPQNQWTWNHVLALSLIRHSCATFPVLLNVRFHPGQLGDLVLTKIVMTSKAKKVCNIKMACLKLPSIGSNHELLTNAALCSCDHSFAVFSRMAKEYWCLAQKNYRPILVMIPED